MLETAAIVVRIQNGETFVEAVADAGCGSDHCTPKGCATVQLTQLFSQKPRSLQVDNPIDARVGERVMVGLEEGAFLQSASVAYLLPLAALMAGALLGLWLADEAHRDGYAGLGALIGLVWSALVVKYYYPKLGLGKRIQARILRRLA